MINIIELSILRNIIIINYKYFLILQNETELIICGLNIVNIFNIHGLNLVKTKPENIY